MAVPIFFCLWVPEFSAQVLTCLRPALAKAAVAVLEGNPPFEAVCSANLQARRLGVRHGMTSTGLGSFPHLAVLSRSQAEEQSAARTLLKMAARFTSCVEELPRCSAQTLALKMSGSPRVFGPPHIIRQKIFRAARELGFFSRIISSHNLNTAACLARDSGISFSTALLGEGRTGFYDLPLTVLDLTDELLGILNAWGLRTAGDLAALMPDDYVDRLCESRRLHRPGCRHADRRLSPSESPLPAKSTSPPTQPHRPPVCQHHHSPVARTALRPQGHDTLCGQARGWEPAETPQAR